MKINAKTVLTMFTMILMITSIATVAITPTQARDITSHIFVSVAPTTVGVNQEAAVYFWLNQPPPTASGAQGERWEGYMVEVTKPDGTKENKGPFQSDAVGSAFIAFIPTQVGLYTFVSSFPGQTSDTGDYYEPSTSFTATLTVQEDQISFSPDTPHPTEPWTRPIFGENTLWAKGVGSNWLMAGYDYTARFFDVGSAFNPQTTSPGSAHVLWTRQIDDGGIVGGAGAIDGSAQAVGYYQGMSYEAKFNPPLVVNGRIYTNTGPGNKEAEVQVWDLYTGELLWTMPGVSLDLGQIYDYESPNQHGAQAYLWDLGGTYRMYDAFTGDLLVTVENATNGVAVLSPVGDLLVYAFSGGQNRMRLWNSSLAIPKAGTSGSEAWQWRPDNNRASVIDWSDGVQWDVTFPDTPGNPSMRSFTRTYDGEVAITMAQVTDSNGNPVIVETGYPMTFTRTTLPNGTMVYPTTANYLWTQNRTTTRQDNPQPIWLLLDYGTMSEGVYTYRARDELITYGYSATTGNQMWVTEPTTLGWSLFPAAAISAYGNHYLATYDGNVYAYDLQTGETVWQTSTGDPGFDNPYGVRPIYSGIVIADGKIWAANGEHSPSQPLWKGNKLTVMDAETGEIQWDILGWFTGHRTMVVDGIFVGHNGYDNQVYAIGKGPSKTTVTAPQTQITLGTKVVVSGTVTDQTPASKDTPAISDEDMSAWMEYIHMQQPVPFGAKGVEVSLDTIDPNGNFVNIGTITSDMGGNFGMDWAPEVPGLYTIIATFEGSESYGSSYAETYVYAEDAPIATPTPAPTPAPQTDSYVLGTGIAILAAIGIVGFLLLRKK